MLHFKCNNIVYKAISFFFSVLMMVNILEAVWSEKANLILLLKMFEARPYI